MLNPFQTYEEALSKFRWEFPKYYNMGWDACDKWADVEPDRTAIIDLTSGGRKDVPFSEVKSKSNQLANLLVSLDIEQGDRVGVFRSQSVWTAASHIAVWKMAGISMPLFKLFGEEALLSRLNDSGAKVIITDTDGADTLKALRDKLPKLKHIIVPELLAENAQPDEFEIAKTNAETPGLLIYTSGTTGAPKGALHAHRVLRGHLPGIEMSHDLLPQEEDVLWTPADWAWIGGLMNVLMPALHHGVPIVASRVDKFGSQMCREIIEAGNVKNIFFPPTALRLLKAENFKISGLRTVGCGGEPLGEEMQRWGKQALGLTINEFYGQTECNMVLSSCEKWFEPKLGAIGKPVPGHQVEVIDDQGNPTHEEGDIAVKRGSASMMLEYWNNPEATKDKFRGDWLLTGDRGIREGEFIRFVGRDDDVISSSGYRIGPAEIEDCLLKHEAVASVGVIGKPDETRTEIVKAYVVLRGGYSPSPELLSSLQQHVKTKLAAYEYPREIEFVDHLPMTVTGKIIRKELKARAIAELEKA
jgi:acetyl-CoA synthetase